MKIKTKTAIIILVAFLAAYIGLFTTDISMAGFSYTLLIAPILLVWVVYIVLRDDSYRYKELGSEEWGYRDKAKDELGMF